MKAGGAGMFDGNGTSMDDVYVNRPDEQCVMLFIVHADETVGHVKVCSSVGES